MTALSHSTELTLAPSTDGARDQAERRFRLGVMGGTFDPIHHGHLVAASEVQSLLDLDEVVFVPTGQPYRKAGVSPAEHRYLMTVIATASNPRFTVSRVDIDRKGDTYTIDTLRDLHGQRPDAELFFITGADALAQILSWKDATELWDLAHFVGVTRPGYVLSEAGLREDRVTLQEVPAMSISSTDCRERVADGEPVWYLVPDGVVQYINKHHLYAPGAPRREAAAATSPDSISPDSISPDTITAGTSGAATTQGEA